jgi:hypothetical protein
MCADDHQRAGVRRAPAACLGTYERASATPRPAVTLGLVARRTVFVACMGLMGLSLSACDDPSRSLAQDVLSRTIPPGDPVPSLSEPVRSGQSLQFTWDFESRMDPTGYADWLKTRLGDFQVIDGRASNLHLAKQVDGDAYRLHVTLLSGTGVTGVHMQLTASPD